MKNCRVTTKNKKAARRLEDTKRWLENREVHCSGGRGVTIRAGKAVLVKCATELRGTQNLTSFPWGIVIGGTC